MQAESKKEEKEEEAASDSASGNGVNPASSVQEESASGLGKLDAGKEADSTPVEDKIEAVASAIGGGDEQEEESPKVE